MYGLGQPPPMLPMPHPAAVPGQMNPSYQANSLPGYPATAPTGEQSYTSAIAASQAAAYASNATSPRGTPPTIGFSPSVYAQGATPYAAYGAPTYHGSTSYPYSAALSSASTVTPSPYNPSSYSQTVPSSLSSQLSYQQQQAAAVQAQQASGMLPQGIQMIQGVPRTVYVTDSRVSPAMHGQHPQGIQQKATIPSSAGLMSGAQIGTTSPHAAAAAAAAQAAYYPQGSWQQQQQQQQAAAAAQTQQAAAAAAQQPLRNFNPYAHHW